MNFFYDQRRHFGSTYSTVLAAFHTKVQFKIFKNLYLKNETSDKFGILSEVKIITEDFSKQNNSNLKNTTFLNNYLRKLSTLFPRRSRNFLEVQFLRNLTLFIDFNFCIF